MYKLVMIDYSLSGANSSQLAQNIRKKLKDAEIEQPYICCVAA